ncbi:MAG: hypothetical protein DRI97_03925 [Bacteroidetes bacterium]|nr:MAG: hypothetical protein DRQ42_00440 [Gammaproteobacteria bacterium]RLD58103.1 MAG: hypothetical protein DRI97_03925 [Bacteroidota bacterium]
MKTWKIPCSWEVYAVAKIKAETLEAAIEIAEDDDFPLPTETHYVDASFLVDKDLAEHMEF